MESLTYFLEKQAGLAGEDTTEMTDKEKIRLLMRSTLDNINLSEQIARRTPDDGVRLAARVQARKDKEAMEGLIKALNRLDNDKTPVEPAKEYVDGVEKQASLIDKTADLKSDLAKAKAARKARLYQYKTMKIRRIGPINKEKLRATNAKINKGRRKPAVLTPEADYKRRMALKSGRYVDNDTLANHILKAKAMYRQKRVALGKQVGRRKAPKHVSSTTIKQDLPGIGGRSSKGFASFF
jgi:hypothetical protein